MNDCMECVKVLLEFKADYRIKNSLDKTATEEAYDRALYHISEYLIEQEPDSSLGSSIIQEDLDANELDEELRGCEEK